MATITITDENGKSKTLNQWKINDINIVQETGESLEKVMSQRAVTTELNQRAKLIQSPDYPNIYEFEKSIVFDCGDNYGEG